MSALPLPGARLRRGLVATAAGTALLVSGLGLSPAQATPGRQSLPANPFPAANCTAGGPTATFTVVDFNDFHGRIAGATKLFTEIEKTRAAKGEANVLAISSGDNIGGSTFESASQDDKPTLDVLNAGALDVSTVGNHEFDKGWTDLSGRVEDAANFPWLGANVYAKGTTTVAAPLKEYQIFEKGGLKVAVVGAVTADLRSLVSPAGIDPYVTVGDPVQAVNRVAAQLKDGNEANGEADIVIASLHEGAPSGSATPAANAAESKAFASIYNDISTNVNLVFNAHTHQTYNWTTSKTGVPLMQAGSYAEKLARVTLVVDTDDNKVCTATPEIIDMATVTADTTLPRVAAIKTIVDKAVADAEVVGAEVVGSATAPISLPGGLMKPDQRDKESPASNLIAQMFYDVLGNGNPEFIGMQNPGGTRAGFDAGDITYKEAALTLPFANTLKTTQITGAQFVKVLEQQWQRDDKGNVPSRPYLRLGLSKNVSYTYDETLPEGSRITSVSVNGAPIVATKLYTVGSGSFLIEGGDNFWELAEGVNTRDTGQVDLTAMVDWVKAKKTLSPSFVQTGVSVKGPKQVFEGSAATFVVGTPSSGGLAVDTLDSTGQAAVPNTSLAVSVRQGSTTIDLPSATVSAGKATVQVSLPFASGLSDGPATLQLSAAPSGTKVALPITVVTSKRATVWGDQTGDGYGDVLAVDSSGVLKIFPGGKTSLKGTSWTVGPGWDAFTWLSHTPDVNGDGTDDLIGRRADGSMHLYLGQGMGNYAAPRKIGSGWNGLSKLTVVGDMTGDGRPELVGVTADGSLMRYTITGTWLQNTTKIGHGWLGIDQLVGLGSVNGDKYADVVAIDKAGMLRVYTTQPTGALYYTATTGHGWTGHTAFSPGDLTGDGVPDLVARDTTGVLYLFQNLGNGRWGKKTDISTPVGLNFKSYAMFG